MNPQNTATLINILGFVVGIALYSLLLLMVWRYGRTRSKIDYLLVLTAVLGLLWNVGELFTFVSRDLVNFTESALITAVSYSALGFLPSVVVHSAEGENRQSRVFTIAAYGLSVLASVLHFQSILAGGTAPSNLALQILTIGAIALIIGLLIFSTQRKVENKTVWILALSIFAVSALHLSSKTEGNNWLIELVAHQSSLPLVLAILLQDFRFAFADLFLKRALSLLLLSLTAFALFVYVAQPLNALSVEGGAVSVAVILVLWIVTALAYPFLHSFSVWLVDKILLRRVSYEQLLSRISNSIESVDSDVGVLEEVSGSLQSALTASHGRWVEIDTRADNVNLPTVDYGIGRTRVFVPTSEAPYYEISVEGISGGRNLLSEEVQMLESVALVSARRIDAIRVVNERLALEVREKEYSKLAAEAKLTALRSQINPHFLFNALNTIGYLIRTAPDTAFSTLMKLTKLLRSVLRSDAEFLELNDELALIENYLEIEKARFEERLKFEIDVPDPLRKEMIPPLLLQPLVENAVKHGISNSTEGGKVTVSAAIENGSSERQLRLEVADSGATDADFEFGEGIGLRNIQGRLKSYYGSRASFQIQRVNGNTVASVKIPVERTP